MDNTSDKSQTPEEFETLIEPEASLPEISLEDLPEPLRAAVARAGWPGLMPVQAKSLPYLLTGQDLMVQSRTGSGKTGAFLLPIFNLLDLGVHQTQALILCPTRELAKQVAMEAEMLFEGTELRVATVYGGVGYGPQTDALRAGAHLVVGTPGRILDHLLRRNLTLDGMRVLVFDEADRMLSIGFYPDMKEIKRYLPPKRRVSTFLFSATYPPHVLRLAEEFMDHPNFLSLSAKQVHVADILHVYHEVPGMDKDRCLVRLLEIENPTSAIIFSNTKANVHYITEVLKGFGYDAEELSADLTQAKREQVLMRLRKGTLRFLVATDVAARGIDIPELSHVFQYETPEDPESYVHRAGRTGRAGASGTAITLVNIMEELAMKRIGQRFGIELVKKPVPTDEDVSAVVSERLTALLEAEVRTLAPLKKVRLQRFLPLAQELAASEDAALLALLLDERYQATLHAVQVQPEGAPEEPREQRRERDYDRDRDRGRDRDRDRGRSRDRDRQPRREPRQDGAPATRPEAELESRPAPKAQPKPKSSIFTAPADETPDEDDFDSAFETALDGPQDASANVAEGGEPAKKRKRRRRRKRKPASAEAMPQDASAAPEPATSPEETPEAKPAAQASPAREPRKQTPVKAPVEAAPDGLEPSDQAPQAPKDQAEGKAPARPARTPRAPRKPAPKKTAAKTEPQEASDGAKAPESSEVGDAQKPKAKPRSRKPAAKAKTQDQPRNEPAPEPENPDSPAKALKAERPGKTAKSVEIEYRPDEHKGIEWD
ncbi:MAG: DEAD/DEAH box helicase [Acidobacteriota bacterium]